MRRKRGFTLIELLIVIALLGALAVGLIGAIDPFEQLKKGTDTGTRDLVNQVQTAMIRYYSVKNEMPWTGNDPNEEALSGGTVTAAINNMIGTGELRSDFLTIQSAKLDKVFVTGNAADSTVAVCYMPTSKSFQADPNTKYERSGDVANGCKSETPPGSSDCYWCIK